MINKFDRFDDLKKQINDAMAIASPEHVRWATDPQGATRWVSLVGLASLCGKLWGCPPKVAIEKCTHGRFRKLRDFCIAQRENFTLAVDNDGNDWIATPDSSGRVCLYPSFRRVGETKELPAGAEALTQKIREAMHNLGKGEDVSLVQLGLEYRKIHGVSLKEDIVFHTHGVYSRFVDWVMDASRDFAILRGPGTAVSVCEKNSWLPSKPSLAPEKASGTKKVIAETSLTVAGLATMLATRPFRIISELMDMGIFASLTQKLSAEIATRIALKYGIELEIRREKKEVESFQSIIPHDQTQFFNQSSSSLWETAFSGKRVYVDTGVLMSQRFWRELSTCGINISPASVLILAPVVHELLELESRGAETCTTAKQALYEIKAARTAGWLRIVPSGFSELPDNYADIHFIRLSSAPTFPVSIITADYRLITEIKAGMDRKLVSLYFFDRNRGTLKPHFRIEVDDLV